MERKTMKTGFMMLIFGMFSISMPLIYDYTLCEISTGLVGESFVTTLGQFIKYICQFVGNLFLIVGMVCFLIGFANPYCKSSYETYDSYSQTLMFWVLEGRRAKSIDVKLGNLSKDTIKVLRDKIETPLKTLYEATNKGKRAKEEYRNCGIYITSLAEDLNKAISQCENELMEQKLLEKLYIIQDAIKNITEKVNDAIRTDKDEERYLKELQLESFEPFTITENINKLENI